MSKKSCSFLYSEFVIKMTSWIAVEIQVIATKDVNCLRPKLEATPRSQQLFIVDPK